MDWQASEQVIGSIKAITSSVRIKGCRDAGAYKKVVVVAVFATSGAPIAALQSAREMLDYAGGRAITDTHGSAVALTTEQIAEIEAHFA